LISGQAASSARIARPRRLGIMAGAFGVALVLSACGGSVLDSYSLVAPKQLSGRASSQQMIVTEPVATLPYDSERIVVRTGVDGVAYLKGAQWVERLPRHRAGQDGASLRECAAAEIGRPRRASGSARITCC